MTSRIERWLRNTGSCARIGHAGIGAVRIALLFGSAAVALALILTPLAERRSREATVFQPGIDRVMTGTVSDSGSAYTVRRSILQPSPEAICIISADGSRSGAC